MAWPQGTLNCVYRQRYVDLIVNPEVKTDLCIPKARSFKAIRDFLNDRDYLEVENADDAFPSPAGATAKTFQDPSQRPETWSFTSESLQSFYLKRLVGGGALSGFTRSTGVFATKACPTEHNPEFTMLEFYTAYADYNDLMDLTEELFRVIGQSVFDTLQFPYTHVVDGEEKRRDI